MREMSRSLARSWARRHLAPAIAYSLVPLAMGCSDFPLGKSVKTASVNLRVMDSGISKKVATTAVANGAVSAVIYGNSNLNQVLSSIDGTAIEGAGVSFPPNSTAVTTTVTVAPGLTLSNPNFYRTLEISGKSTAVGTPIQVSSSVIMDTVKPFYVDLKIPFTATDPQNPDFPSMVVFYSVQKSSPAATFAGVYVRSAIQIVNGKARIRTTHFGTFQLVLMESVIDPVTEKEVQPAQIAKRTYFSRGLKTVSFKTGKQSLNGFQGWLSTTSDPKVSTSTNIFTTGYQVNLERKD